MEIINEKEINNKCLFSCSKCKYNTKQEKNYEKHLLTAKHKKNCCGINNISTTDSIDSYKDLYENECKKTENLEKEMDELKGKNSMLITKLIDLTEKYYNLQNDKSKVTNTVTNNTVNNNQTYNINIYLNQGLMEIQGSVINPDTNSTIEFTKTIPFDNERLARMESSSMDDLDLCNSMDFFKKLVN